MRSPETVSRGVGCHIGPRVLPLLLVASVSACDIETEPLGLLTTENFFQNADQAIAATNATYSMLRMWPVHVFAWIGLTDIASDDATKGSVPGDASFLQDLDNLSFDPGNIAFLDTWTGYYQGIYRANVALQGIAQVTNMDAALRDRLLAENRFLRAYFYFFLARAYGGVPLLTEPLRPGEFSQQRATREAVYDLIEQDLLDAITVLPERSQYSAADLGRATKGAARGFLAEVYLYQGDYENAYAQAQSVITSGQYSLFSDYETLFTREGENSSESVFEVQSVALAQGGAGSQYQQVQGVRGTPNIGWGFNTPSAELEDSYEPGDPRLTATILYPWELLPDGSGRVVFRNPSMPNNRYNQKVFISPETPGGSGNGGVNIRRLRYAHVLLTGAEAAARTGREGEALNWLNQVRARARGDRTVTLGVYPEVLATSIANVLELPDGTSRVFVRHVDPDDAAYAAGLRSFEDECVGSCPSDDVPPVRVLNLDIIQAVDGAEVTTLAEYFAELEEKSPGQQVTLDVLRVTQSGDATNTESVTFTVTAEALLPDVGFSGQQLLEAIWRERRHELAMEQHRWFDVVRQGRAPELLAIHGKSFAVGKHELYPIPTNDVTVAGLQQNPGY